MKGLKTYVIIILLLTVVIVISIASVAWWSPFTWNRNTFSMFSKPETIQTNQGTITVNKNKLPGDWPSDVPTYPGAIISSSFSGAAGIQVSFKTGDSVSQVLDYFKSHLTASGWKIIVTENVRSGSVIAATKDTRVLSVVLPISLKETIITETVGAER